MYRLITVLVILGCCSIILGCSVGQTILSKQEWSENYTQMAGVTSTSPQMIDGNLQTVGETESPMVSQGGGRGASPPSDVVITLPEKKMIRRVVIHSESLMTFNVYADKGGVGDQSDWHLVKEVKSVQTNPIDVSISTGFPTAKIRIIVLRTNDDASVGRQQRARSGGGGRGFGGNLRAAAKINEIELYGYQSASEPKAAGEQTLDEQLK